MQWRLFWTAALAGPLNEHCEQACCDREAHADAGQSVGQIGEDQKADECGDRYFDILDRADGCGGCVAQGPSHQKVGQCAERSDCEKEAPFEAIGCCSCQIAKLCGAAKDKKREHERRCHKTGNEL